LLNPSQHADRMQIERRADYAERDCAERTGDANPRAAPDAVGAQLAADLSFGWSFAWYSHNQRPRMRLSS
jgi:hypothetical protein